VLSKREVHVQAGGGPQLFPRIGEAAVNVLHIRHSACFFDDQLLDAPVLEGEVAV
jgi:hypothetical protein